MPDNSPDQLDDHTRLLALARAAMQARDDAKLWKLTPEEAAEIHGAHCDALWDELERQVVVADGRVPVLEHPTVKQRRLARQMRTEILAAVQGAVCEAIDDIDHGMFNWEDD